MRNLGNRRPGWVGRDVGNGPRWRLRTWMRDARAPRALDGRRDHPRGDRRLGGVAVGRAPRGAPFRSATGTVRRAVRCSPLASRAELIRVVPDGRGGRWHFRAGRRIVSVLLGWLPQLLMAAGPPAIHKRPRKPRAAALPGVRAQRTILSALTADPRIVVRAERFGVGAELSLAPPEMYLRHGVDVVIVLPERERAEVLDEIANPFAARD